MIDMQLYSLCMGAYGAIEGTVAWVSLTGAFLLCEMTLVFCALKPV